MIVADLFHEIKDGLDMSGEIVSIDVIKDNGKPVSLSIKATCPNYPEQSCGYYQISLSDISECRKSVCYESGDANWNADLKKLASYEFSSDVTPEKQ